MKGIPIVFYTIASRIASVCLSVFAFASIKIVIHLFVCSSNYRVECSTVFHSGFFHSSFPLPPLPLLVCIHAMIVSFDSFMQCCWHRNFYLMLKRFSLFYFIASKTRYYYPAFANIHITFQNVWSDKRIFSFSIFFCRGGKNHIHLFTIRFSGQFVIYCGR